MNSKTCKKKVSKRTNTKNGGNINQRISCKSVILDNRLDRCNYIINNFLNASRWKNILYYIDKYIKLDNIILNFDTVLGEGSFGKVVLSSINHNNKIYNISIKIIKIIKINNYINLLKSEINLIKRASYFIEKKINPHFLFYYGYIMFTGYVVIIFEKLSGSVMDKTMDIILNKKNEYLFNIQNIVTQILLSIFSFHKFTRHYHNDTKFNNFLYIYDETVKNNNYYIYNYNNKNYYLPCTNFVIIISDYGFARQINNNNIIYLPDIGHNPFNEKYSAKYTKKYTNMIVDYVSVIDSLLILKYNIQDINKFLNDVKNVLLSFDNKNINKIKNVNDVNNYENELLEKLIEQPWFQLKGTTQQNVINNKNPYILSHK